MLASFGVRWVAGDIPTFYLDVGAVQQIFIGHGIAYGRPLPGDRKSRNDESARHPKWSRTIHIYEKMYDVDPFVVVHLGWNHMMHPHSMQVTIRGQQINLNMGSDRDVQRVTKAWDAGWAEIARDYGYATKAQESDERSRESRTIQTLPQHYKSDTNIQYSFHRLELDASEIDDNKEQSISRRSPNVAKPTIVSFGSTGTASQPLRFGGTQHSHRAHVTRDVVGWRRHRHAPLTRRTSRHREQRNRRSRHHVHTRTRQSGHELSACGAKEGDRREIRHLVTRSSRRLKER